MYSLLYQQKQKAEMEMQKAKPSFFVIQRASVPIVKAGPARSIKVGLFVFVVALILSLYAFYKEGDLIRFLLGDLVASKIEETKTGRVKWIQID